MGSVTMPVIVSLDVDNRMLELIYRRKVYRKHRISGAGYLSDNSDPGLDGEFALLLCVSWL